jgi:hypothetical protein
MIRGNEPSEDDGVRTFAKRDKAIEIVEELHALRRRIATYPILDKRPADAILGYDEDGLPG